MSDAMWTIWLVDMEDNPEEGLRPFASLEAATKHAKGWSDHGILMVVYAHRAPPPETPAALVKLMGRREPREFSRRALKRVAAYRNRKEVTA